MEQVLASSVRSKREISCAKQQKVSNTWGKNIKNSCKCLLFQVWISFSSIINNTAWNAVESQAAPPLPGLQRRWACHGWLQHVTANTLYHRKNLKTVSIVSSRNVLAFTANDRFHSNPCRYSRVYWVYCLFLFTSQPNRGKTSDCHQLHISKLPPDTKLPKHMTRADLFHANTTVMVTHENWKR